MRPFVSRFIENRLECLFGTSLADNMAFTAAAAFACGFSAIADEPLGSVYPFAFAVMTLAWILSSLAAGFLKQWAFILYSAAFWFLPLLFAAVPNAEEATALNDVLARLSELITSAAPKLLEQLQISGSTVCQGFLAGSLVLFFTGFIGRKRARRYKLYCEIRLKLIQGQ